MQQRSCIQEWLFSRKKPSLDASTGQKATVKECYQDIAQDPSLGCISSRGMEVWAFQTNRELCHREAGLYTCIAFSYKQKCCECWNADSFIEFLKMWRWTDSSQVMHHVLWRSLAHQKSFSRFSFFCNGRWVPGCLHVNFQHSCASEVSILGNQPTFRFYPVLSSVNYFLGGGHNNKCTLSGALIRSESTYNNSNSACKVMRYLRVALPFPSLFHELAWLSGIQTHDSWVCHATHYTRLVSLNACWVVIPNSDPEVHSSSPLPFDNRATNIQQQYLIL